jgi:hypothetical protein
MQFSAQIGREKVYLECDPQFASVGEQILDLINNEARSGSEVFAGMSIQFGWSLLTLRHVAGRIVLHEPDFAHDPTSMYRPDVTCSIDVYLRQQAVIQAFGLTAWSPAGCFDEIIAAHGSLTDHALIAKHYSSSSKEKGWVLFRKQDDRPLSAGDLSSQYGKLPVWQLLHIRPALLDFLALPAGFTVFLQGDALEQAFNDNGELWSLT